MPREFKTVLAPIDFSEDSYYALGYALRFARAAEGTLILLHVLHDPMTEEFRPEGYVMHFEDVMKRAAEKLETIRKEKLDGYPRCEMVVVVGDPHLEIVQTAGKRKADLIVISTHGRGGLDHLLIGSVTEKTVRHAPCPVLVIRKGVE